MRSFRSAFFVCIAFLFLGAVTGVDSVIADVSAVSSAGAVAVSAAHAEPAVSAAEVELPVLDGLPTWLQALSLIISACAGIAAFTPTPKDDGVLSILRKLVDLLALNFGGARNAAANRNSSNRL